MANTEDLPVKVPVDAAFEDVVQAYERLWAIANPGSTDNVTLAVANMRPDVALRLIDRFGDNGSDVLFTSSLSGRRVKQEPRDTAERQARHLVQMLEYMGWREPGSVPTPPLEPGRLEAARRIADTARHTDPAEWPGWSTSEQIVAALAANRSDRLPASYQDAGEAWARLDNNQRAAVREADPWMARFCKEKVDEAT
ncbi:hypothetical protein [Rhodovibrio salinarum]|uniref:Uncharacterized protein n=1 Tax=Rhodovibrio salinarum TaxID=1087 RepID=A0A934QEW2_9PROT|nr:hypothetical protein [Rhodovibrio salinarum]MBK1695649.1 hypothetical protein [Rhodovibrio salinarum]